MTHLDLDGDGVELRCGGATVGYLKADEHGNMHITKADGTPIQTWGHNGKVQISPGPEPDPVFHLTVRGVDWDDGSHGDVWFRGCLRLGHAIAFKDEDDSDLDSPCDPAGSVQLGRARKPNQDLCMVRMFSRDADTGARREARIGMDRNGWLALMKGDSDTPLLVLRPDPGRLLYGGEVNGAWRYTELSTDNGTVKGQHPTSGRVVTLIPE